MRSSSRRWYYDPLICIDDDSALDTSSFESQTLLTLASSERVPWTYCEKSQMCARQAWPDLRPDRGVSLLSSVVR
eukprot:43131-Eustigmatos_ZCMA.PRE.1